MIIGGDQSVSIAVSVASDFVKKATTNGMAANKRVHPAPDDVI